MSAAAAVPNGPAEPPWLTPAECYLADGALPPGSALLSSGTAGAAEDGWRRQLKHHWQSQAMHRMAAVIEGVVAHGDIVFIQLYGHPWVFGEYWPMIAPCFQVRAIEDTGAEHEGMPGSGGERRRAAGSSGSGRRSRRRRSGSG